MPEISVNSLSELPAVAHQIIQAFGERNVIAFQGQMGAGKTTLIKAICVALGVTDTISSPTFSLVNEYQSAQKEKMYHFDFYRIKTIDEAYDMGFEDYIYSNALCFIEWPERVEELLPMNCVYVNIRLDGETRVISVTF